MHLFMDTIEGNSCLELMLGGEEYEKIFASYF